MPRRKIIRASNTPYFCLLLITVVASVLVASSRLAVAGSDCSVISFNAAPSYSSGIEPNFVASADFNGDGIRDLAISHSAPDYNHLREVVIMQGDGAGNFSATVKLKIVADSPPGFIATGDFNGDGKPDLAVSAISYASVSVFLNNGSGGFGPPTTFNAGLKPNPLIIHDFNGDGKMDLAAGDIEDRSLLILFGDGAGGFPTSKKITLFHYVSAMELGDFNNDGKTDILASGSSMSVLLGDGAGNFITPQSSSPGGSKGVRAADFNSDGKLDVVAIGGNDVELLLGNGAGGFSNPIDTGELFGASLTVGDFNADGKSDFAVINTSHNRVTVMLGNGAGKFTAKRFAAGAIPTGILSADLNLDGKLDLAVVNIKSNDVSILIGKGDGDFNATPNYAADTESNSMGGMNSNPIAAGDFNKDGALDLAIVNYITRFLTIHLADGKGGFKAPVRYFAGYTARSVTVADFNGDGKLDVTVSHPPDGLSAVTTYFGKGDGTFNLSDFGWNINLNFTPVYIQAGDFNNDGKPDLALHNGFRVSILLNTGKGFSLAGGINAGDSLTSISLGDLNRDGNLDVVAANSANTPDKNFLVLAFGDGAGGIGSSRTMTIADYLYTATVFDVNGDAIPDIVAATYQNPGNSVSVSLGDGSGNFSQPQHFQAEFGLFGTSYAVAGGDFNGDGKPDIAVTGLGVNSVAVLPGNGTGGFGASMKYGVGANPRALVTGDFNNDGKSDVVTANYTSSDFTPLFTIPCTRPAPSPTPVPTPTPLPTPVGNYVEFSSSSYTFNEGTVNGGQGFGTVNITVLRGDIRFPSTVQFITFDSSGGNECSLITPFASQRCDYSTVGGTLRFAAGEASKTIQIPIVNDGYQEGTETFFIKLFGPGGVFLGEKSEAAITIQDDAADANPTNGANNPYLSNEFFVRMNYLDFLSREPDPDGFSDWTNVLNNCGPQKGFLGAPYNCDRAHVSHGFFGSEEFTNRGYLIYRLYEVGMNRLPRYSEFTPDMANLSGFGLSDTVKEQNLQGYLQQFTLNRPEFGNRFSDAMQPSQAATLIQRMEQTAGITLPATATTRPGQPQQYGRQELINLRANGTFTVGQTLRAFVEQQAVYDKYFERGFVTMQYFGYLKRDPDLNDPNLSGWKEWVFVFTNGGAQRGRPDIAPRDIHHLIFGFIYSEEYRKRFGQP